MEDIEDDRSEVLAAAEVDRGGLQPLAHAASAAAKTTRTNGGFRHRMALLMLDYCQNSQRSTPTQQNPSSRPPPLPMN